MNDYPEQEKTQERLPKMKHPIDSSSLGEQTKTWFQNLSQPAQIAVVVGGAFIGFAALNMVLKIVTSLLTMLVLGAILYVIYRFLLSNSK